MAREKTVTDKKQYWKDYYASHKDRYRDWARARRERIKLERAGKTVDRKVEKTETGEVVPNQPVDTSNVDFANLVNEVMGSELD